MRHPSPSLISSRRSVARRLAFLLTALLSAAPAHAWQTSFPAAADTYIQRSSTSDFGANGSFLVKRNTAGASNSTDRIGYLRFAIGEPSAEIDSAGLFLTITNYPGDGGTPFTFELFGLPDGHPDETFDESALNFQNATNASDTLPGSFDPAGLVPLGTFTPPVAAGTVTLEVTNTALRDFIAADTNAHLSFAVFRVTPDGALPTSFASGEAASILQRPTLQIRSPHPLLPVAATTASSTAAGSAPALAVDGNVGTAWSAEPDASGSQAWILLDLGSPQTANGITFCVEKFGRSWRLEASNDGSSWSPVSSDFSDGPGRDPNVLNRFTTRHFHAPDARYFRLTSLSAIVGESAALREIRLFNDADAGPFLTRLAALTASVASLPDATPAERIKRVVLELSLERAHASLDAALTAHATRLMDDVEDHLAADPEVMAAAAEGLPDMRVLHPLPGQPEAVDLADWVETGRDADNTFGGNGSSGFTETYGTDSDTFADSGARADFASPVTLDETLDTLEFSFTVGGITSTGGQNNAFRVGFENDGSGTAADATMHFVFGYGDPGNRRDVRFAGSSFSNNEYAAGTAFDADLNLAGVTPLHTGNSSDITVRLTRLGDAGGGLSDYRAEIEWDGATHTSSPFTRNTDTWDKVHVLTNAAAVNQPGDRYTVSAARAGTRRTSADNPYVARMSAGAALFLAEPDLPWHKSTSTLNVLDDFRLARTTGQQIDALFWLFAHPDSPLRHDDEILRRLLRRTHAYLDAILVHGPLLPAGQLASFYDNFANAPASTAFRELPLLHPGLVLPNSAADWSAAMQTGATNLWDAYANRAPSWVNTDVAVAVELFNYGTATGSQPMIDKSRTFIDDILTSGRMFADGGVGYINTQNEAGGYQWTVSEYLTRYFETTGYLPARQVLDAMEWFGPVNGPMIDWWTSPSWKHQWNRISGSDSAGEAVAGSNPYVRAELDEWINAPATATNWYGRPRVDVAWYESGTTPLERPDYVTFDRNIQGPRAWQGLFNSTGTLRPIAATDPGHSTLMGCQVMDPAPDFRVNAAVMGVFPRIRTSPLPSRDAGDGTFANTRHAWLTSGLVGDSTVAPGFSSLAASHKIHIYGSSTKGAEQDWTARQVWLNLPDRIVGLIDLSPNADLSAYEVQGAIRLGFGGTVYSAPKALTATGEEAWTFGDLAVRLHDHNFAEIVPEIYEFRRPQAPITEITLRDQQGGGSNATPVIYPAGSRWKFVTEIGPASAPGELDVTELATPDGLIGLELHDPIGNRRFRILYNPGPATVVHTPQPGWPGQVRVHRSGARFRPDWLPDPAPAPPATLLQPDDSFELEPHAHLVLESRPINAFEDWSTSYQLTPPDDGFDSDPDQDLLSNGLEFALGRDPTRQDPPPVPLEPAFTPAGLSLSFSRADASESAVNLALEWSTDLDSWNLVPIGPASQGPDPDGITISVTENGTAHDEIVVLLPAVLGPAGRLFTRLAATR